MAMMVNILIMIRLDIATTVSILGHEVISESMFRCYHRTPEEKHRHGDRRHLWDQIQIQGWPCLASAFLTNGPTVYGLQVIGFLQVNSENADESCLAYISRWDLAMQGDMHSIGGYWIHG